MGETIRVKNNKLSGTFVVESTQQSNQLAIFALRDILIHEPRIVCSIKERVPVVENLRTDIDGNSNAQRPTFSPSPISLIMTPIGGLSEIGLLFGMVPQGSIV